MRCHWLIIGYFVALVGAARGASTGEAPHSLLRAATFRCDATPALGETLIWDVPLTNIDDPLWAKGIVLEEGRRRFILCALDWCELSGDSHQFFCAKMALAAHTDATRVALQCLHQHTAPYADQRAHELLDAAPKPPAHLSRKFLNDLGDRLAEAVRQAVEHLEPIDQVGIGEAKVGQVASTRRLRSPEGQVIVRYSEGGRNPELAAAPEGFVDPMLKTITLAHGTKPLVRLHYYATHPQTSSCTGHATSDFVGAAREAVEKKENVFQIYFTGCAGDVTVGKYNNGAAEARLGLAQRLTAGMEQAIATSRFVPITRLVWRTVPLRLPVHDAPGFTVEDCRQRLAKPQATPGQRIYEGAMRLAYLERSQRPLDLSSLELGKVAILNLPGEPMLAFQKYAQELRRGWFVAVAGYGDCGPGYICTDEAYAEGGYEPSASNVGPGSEAALKHAIRELLGVKP